METLATYLRSSPFRLHETQWRRFSYTWTLFRIGPLNLGRFSVHHTPSHSICPLSYSHHGLLVSDTLMISFCFTSTYAHRLDGTFIVARYMMNHAKVNIHNHFILCAFPACAERRVPAMCVYESYMSHMGMTTQLDERPRSAATKVG